MTMRLRALHRRGATWLRTLIAAGAAMAAIGAGSAEAVVSAAIVVDAKTGKVLYSSNADTRTYPASLTKIMTLYMLFEALDSGRVTLSSEITVSKHAASQPPSKLGLKPGQSISVKDAILSLVTRSANDIAAAIGEHLGGTESGFAALMTTRARQLGMKSTTFRNASGLPDGGQVTTARDMAILGRAVQDRFPNYFTYFKVSSFTYKGTKIGNHNRLLGRYPGVDGIKTGYIRASGFNLVTSVNQSNRRVVAVVLGGSSGSSRDARMAELLKTYVPKASTGFQIAKRILPSGATVFAANVPTPRTRPDGDIEIETGSVVTAAASVIPQEFRSQGDISDDVIIEEAQPAPVVTSGWKIQIAATPTEAAAMELLSDAKSKGGTVLASAAPYTEPVVKESLTLYRARFAGFAGKSEARAACAYLTKQKFACYAISE
ncbi:D-alanyl-D-alanine carboxypeptidase [Bauldia litoralis]|uniref:D-alanyl-D-alanine carboxypeptidase (Penicillin-binding protein 5/6) n=1 Tax=Bauldia litoralis TaxID=665467 RepID=A0A1G6AVM5_9HYPH|nr:D-alanyl-D-alanine carboxypeptidase family protein [Bauldia litoralis]SDB12323.1 D-alanyl-D-alanine carboxypeptidase (penicillin-binding protein 5/6) [Bauldia litoralis]